MIRPWIATCMQVYTHPVNAAPDRAAAMAMIDQQDALKKWWSLLPSYIAEVQGVLNQVEQAVGEFAEQREKIGNVLGR